MLSTITFLALLSIGLIQAVPITDETCDAKIYNSAGPCTGLVVVPFSCESATADLATTDLKSCDAVRLSWSYPLNNLTIIIETPFTQQRQPYAINIDNKWFKEYPLPIYRILDGQETEIKSTDDIIVQKSDSNYQIIVKLQAETTISYYVFFFTYNVTKS